MGENILKICISNISRTLSYSYLVEIIHKHLSHLVDWNCGVDSTIQTQFPYSIRQGTQMYWVRMGEQHSINLMNISADEIKTGTL